MGYPVARIFVNREKELFVETRVKIDYKYGKFSTQPITRGNPADIVDELIHSIAFDLYAPPLWCGEGR